MNILGIASPANPLAASLRSVCAAMVCLIAATTSAHAQLAANIVAANGAGSDIYSVNFSGSSGTITVLNTDANRHTGIRSLVFRPNIDTGAIDIIAADTPRGELLLYANGVGNSQLIWGPGRPVANPLEGKGPVSPDGLSLDGNGNVFVVCSPGNNSTPEIWVFPRDPSGPLPGGFGLPRLVDNDFPKGSRLVESLSVRVAGTVAAGGSLLVLAAAPNRVLSYSAARLQSVLNGSGETDATELIPGSRFPAGSTPGGMDFWPLDGSLLVTSYDRVLRFSATARLADFATGLGNGKQNKFKIRTARVGASAVAVVADNANGRLLQYTAPGVLSAVITSGVNRPQALAATNAATANASCYQSAAGCDLLGGVLKTRALNIPPNSTSGFLLQEPCVVNTDPRWNGSTWSDVPLPIASVCPGFGSSSIPAYLRGGSGPTGKGLAIVKSASNFILPSGAEVASRIFSENILGSKPPCTAPFTAEIVTWAPTDGEGGVIETEGQLEVTIGCENPLLAGTRGASDWTFGLVLDTTSSALGYGTEEKKLATFTRNKYLNLLTSVQAAHIQSTLKTSIYNCVHDSKYWFSLSKYSKALSKLQYCEQIVRNAWVATPEKFVPTADNPNPYGDIVTRIENIDYTLRHRQSATVTSY